MAKATTLIGAATRFTEKMFKSRSLKREDATPGRERQVKAYEYWDDTPEVRFSAIWVGRAMGRARLFAGVLQDDGEIREAPPGHPAIDLVGNMAGGTTGQSQMLESIGPHLVVAGESWLVVRPGQLASYQLEPVEDWHVLAVTEIEKKKVDGVEGLLAKVYDEEVWIPPAGDEFIDPTTILTGSDAQALAIRIWQPHPRKQIEADSPVMSSFVLLDELRLLNAAVAAMAKSRLGGRGILAVPAGSTLPEGDDILGRLMEVAEIAYRDPSSAAAIIPILMEVPKEAGEIKLITFESTFDELALKLREEAIRRYATASDTPAEVLLGQGDMNHWGVWALQDEAIRVGVEPRLATVCDALTRQWLWPALGSDDAVVWYDTSPLRVRTNKSQTALELGGGGWINGKAVRRETGYDDEDAPAPENERLNILLKAANAVPADSPSREVIAQRIVVALDAVDKLMGFAPIKVEVPSETPEVDAPEGEDLPVDETQAPPDEQPSPDDSPPDGSDGDVFASATDILAASVDQIIVRALERAGHRIAKSRGRSKWAAFKDISPSLIHTNEMPAPDELEKLKLLEGAWERVPEVATRYAVDAQCLTDVLDGYTRDLLITGQAHEYQSVHQLIHAATCLSPA